MPTSFPLPLPNAPSGFATQAALDAAWTTPINDLYALFTGGPQGLIGTGSASTTTTIATTGGASYLPASATVTFTLASTRRVRIAVMSDFQAASAAARFLLRPAYNAGSTAGTATALGTAVSVNVGTSGAAGINGGFNEATVLLAAGTYTAYAGLYRVSGGSATDTGVANAVTVYDMGSS